MSTPDIFYCTTIEDETEPNPPPRPRHPDIPDNELLAARPMYLWQDGATLKVAFTSYDDNMADARLLVKEYASEWSRWANIRFDFSRESANSPDILIQLNDPAAKPHCDSHMGRESRSAIQNGKPSMRLWGIGTEMSNTVAKRTVLHEFGHALGLEHEHLRPDIPVAYSDWNLDKIYADFAASSGWSTEEVDHNFLTRLSKTSGPIRYSPVFDPDSIMCYSIDASWNRQGFSVKPASELSPTDKQYIQLCYPSRNAATDIGFCEAFVDGQWASSGQSQLLIPGTSSRASTPLPLGLNHISLDANCSPRIETTLRVETTGNEFRSDTKIVSEVFTWSDTRMQRGGSTFLQTDQLLGVQTGQWRLPSGVEPAANNTISVLFKNRYKNTPTVVCFLTKVDADRSQNLRIDVKASNITPTGFALEINTWSSSKLYGASATWLAHDPETRGLESGTFERKRSESWPWKVPFKRRFWGTPKAFVAINKLDYDANKWIEAVTKVQGISSTEFELQQFLDQGNMWSLGGSYVAWSVLQMRVSAAISKMEDPI